MQDAADFEQFASSHASLILHVATLLTGNKTLAEDLTLDALRRVHKRDRGADDRTRLLRVLRCLLRGWRHRRQTPAQQARGPLELLDTRPESVTAAVTAASNDAIIRDGLRALSDGERAVLVLNLVADVAVEDLRSVVRRPCRLIRRDLTTSLAFLADATGIAPSRIEADTRQALQMRPRGLSDGAALFANLQPVLAADARQPRRPHASLIAGAATVAVLVAALVVGRFGIGGDDTSGRPVGQPPTSSLELPATGSGLKLVGFKRIMVAVPDAWTQATPLCINVAGDSVIYPMYNELPPCVEAITPGESVAFGTYNAIEGQVAFTSERRQILGEALLTSKVIKRDGEFLQYAALENANVAVSVRSTQRSDLAMLLASIQEVPAAYVVVPNCLTLEPDKASDVLSDNALNGKIFTDSSAAGTQLRMQVVTQSPPVGTLLPFDATVNLGVLPD